MDRKSMAALALALVLSTSVLASAALAASAESGAAAETPAGETQSGQRHGKPDRKPSVAEPENAVGKDAAKAKALADAGVTEEQAGKVKARVSQLEDGTVIYKVHFSYNGQRYSYRIDAVSGDIVNKTVEPVTEDAAATV